MWSDTELDVLFTHWVDRLIQWGRSCGDQMMQWSWEPPSSQCCPQFGRRLGSSSLEHQVFCQVLSWSPARAVSEMCECPPHSAATLLSFWEHLFPSAVSEWLSMRSVSWWQRELCLLLVCNELNWVQAVKLLKHIRGDVLVPDGRCEDCSLLLAKCRLWGFMTCGQILTQHTKKSASLWWAFTGLNNPTVWGSTNCLRKQKKCWQDFVFYLNLRPQQHKVRV